LNGGFFDCQLLSLVKNWYHLYTIARGDKNSKLYEYFMRLFVFMGTMSRIHTLLFVATRCLIKGLIHVFWYDFGIVAKGGKEIKP
jgi:uncharacterized membrane protein